MAVFIGAGGVLYLFRTVIDGRKNCFKNEGRSANGWADGRRGLRKPIWRTTTTIVVVSAVSSGMFGSKCRFGDRECSGDGATAAAAELNPFSSKNNTYGSCFKFCYHSLAVNRSLLTDCF